MDIVGKLKESGNDAFKLGKLDEALDFYTQAINEEKALSKDFRKLAILHSNSAQVYLKQNKFDQAILAASISLENDPGFKKSLLRRGIANFELNKSEEATTDLRSFLRMEPNNQQAVSYLRQVYSFAKLSDSLRKAFIGHHLRREIVKWPPTSDTTYCHPLFVKYLFRSMIISSKAAPVIKELLKNGRICLQNPRVYLFSLPPWFILKRMKVNILQKFLPLTLSKPMMMFVIQVVRPPGLSLELDDAFSLLELSSFYEFEKVCCLSNFLLNDATPSLTPIKQFNRVSKFLTGLAYFDRVPSVPIPKLNYLIIFSARTIGTKFISDWAKLKWPIKCLDFRSAVPDLSSFANFKGVVSNDLTDLHLTSKHSNSTDCETNFFPELIGELAILKNCFPNLKNLVMGVEMIFTFPRGVSISSNNFLKPYLKFLTTIIDAKKIEWCDKPKVCVQLFSQGETTSGALKDMKFIEETVKQCRKEMKELTFIRFNGPSVNTLDIINYPCGHARIEMESKGVLFDISFHVM